MYHSCGTHNVLKDEILSGSGRYRSKQILKVERPRGLGLSQSQSRGWMGTGRPCSVNHRGGKKGSVKLLPGKGYGKGGKNEI